MENPNGPFVTFTFYDDGVSAILELRDLRTLRNKSISSATTLQPGNDVLAYWQQNRKYFKALVRKIQGQFVLLFLFLFLFLFFFCSILFYSILFYSILFYSILFYSILFYSILFYSIMFCSVFCSALFCSVLFWFVQLFVPLLILLSLLLDHDGESSPEEKAAWSKDMTKRRRQSSKKGTPSSESRAEGEALIEEALSLASSSQDTSNPRDSSRSSINNNRQSGQH